MFPLFIWENNVAWQNISSMNSIDFMYLVLLIVGSSSGCLWVVSANGIGIGEVPVGYFAYSVLGDSCEADRNALQLELKMG
jgi:hypothetical protein